jgi:hypothetical protein
MSLSDNVVSESRDLSPDLTYKRRLDDCCWPVSVQIGAGSALCEGNVDRQLWTQTAQEYRAIMKGKLLRVTTASLLAWACLHCGRAQAQFTFGPSDIPTGSFFYGQFEGPVNSVSGPLPVSLPSGQLTVGSTVVEGQGQCAAMTSQNLAALSTSGSMSMTSNGPVIQTYFGGTGNLSYGLAVPPPNGDYYYYLSQASLTVSGTLAPNTSLNFLFHLTVDTNEPGGTPPNFTFLFTDSTPGAFSKTFDIYRYDLGDWYLRRQTGGLGTLAFNYEAFLGPVTAGAISSGTSTVSVDPTFGVLGSPKPLSVPEPSSFLLLLSAVSIALIYSHSRHKGARSARGRCTRSAATRS